MAELKNAVTDANVGEFLASIDDARRADCNVLVELMQGISGEPARMWGKQMVGFGSYHYVYDSGREGDWFLCGFSPRKKDYSIYVMAGFDDYPEIMQRLGTYKTGRSCLYVKSLESVDLNALRELLAESVAATRTRYG